MSRLRKGDVAIKNDALSNYVFELRSLWLEYQERGPGNVSGARWDAVQQAKVTLVSTHLPSKLEDVIARSHDLARKCAEDPQGLSFVTGEGGLVPRKDLHDAFASVLGELDWFRGDS